MCVTNMSVEKKLSSQKRVLGDVKKKHSDNIFLTPTCYLLSLSFPTSRKERASCYIMVGMTDKHAQSFLFSSSNSMNNRSQRTEVIKWLTWHSGALFLALHFASGRNFCHARLRALRSTRKCCWKEGIWETLLSWLDKLPRLFSLVSFCIVQAKK